MIITVSSTDTGLEILLWLQARLPDAPRSYLNQLLRSGKVQLNGRKIGNQYQLAAGDQVSLPQSERMERLLQQSQVQILLETPHCLVACKPSGMPVHTGGAGETNLQETVQTRLRQKGARFRVAPVHRLDRGTSGPVLLGKGKKALGLLGKEFMSRRVRKLYLALVENRTPTAGRLETPVLSKGKERTASARYRTLDQTENSSLLLVQLETGRTHQIRRQLADLGMPLVGDKRYNPHAKKRLRLGLHAWVLEWQDPFDGTKHQICCPVDESFQQLLRQESYPSDLFDLLRSNKVTEIAQQIGGLCV